MKERFESEGDVQQWTRCSKEEELSQSGGDVVKCRRYSNVEEMC